MHAILISEASVSTEVVGSSLAWPEGAVKGSPQKKCLPRRLPSLNEPENFVKSLIRVYLFNFRSFGCCCRKGLVKCHARRCNKIRLQVKSCKCTWATIRSNQRYRQLHRRSMTENYNISVVNLWIHLSNHDHSFWCSI